MPSTARAWSIVSSVQHRDRAKASDIGLVRAIERREDEQGGHDHGGHRPAMIPCTTADSPLSAKKSR